MIRPLIGLVCCLVGQSFFVACMAPVQAPTGTAQVSYAMGGRQYGADGRISKHQLAIALGLGWPQSYQDMIGTFGYPSHRDQSADYYQIEGTDLWLKVHYDGRTATGCETLSSP